MIYFRNYILLLFCFFAFSLQGCDSESKRLQEFMNTPVFLPTQVVKIESNDESIVSLPDNCIRLVYCYSEKECYPCMVSHVYQLCNLFDTSEYFTIILFCPSKNDYQTTVEMVKAANYDFPIYFLTEEESVETRKALSKLKYHSFMLGKDNLPISVGDPVRDDDAYVRFRKALDTVYSK